MHFLRCSHFWTEHFQPGEWYHNNTSGNQSGASQPVTAVRHCRRRYHRYPCHRSCLRMYDPVQVFSGTSRIRTGEFARENEAQGVRYGEVADWGRRKRLWMTYYWFETPLYNLHRTHTCWQVFPVARYAQCERSCLKMVFSENVLQHSKGMNEAKGTACFLYCWTGHYRKRSARLPIWFIHVFHFTKNRQQPRAQLR